MNYKELEYLYFLKKNLREHKNTFIKYFNQLIYFSYNTDQIGKYKKNISVKRTTELVTMNEKIN